MLLLFAQSTIASCLQMMQAADFTDMIACFMRVSWAAAAGKLNLASATPPIRDCNSMTGSWQSASSTRSRQSSTGKLAMMSLVGWSVAML